jgi:AraC family transcriptional regulator of adaptative response / DNA-3-methyladenine glycosylase II
VAQTRRLHFAKKLIDETSLPMNQIALASGFGCVRRFNAGILTVFHRTPTQLRRLVRQTVFQPENQYLFRLRFRPPYDWHGMLAFLGPRATPGVEVVELGSYRRSISLDGDQGYFEVSLDEGNNTLVVRVQFGNPRSLFFIVERIRAMFDLNADWAAIVQGLKTDPALAALVDAHPGLRVPGCWTGFELATRAILGQQVSVKSATTLAGRIVRTFGQPSYRASGLTHLFPSPQVLAKAKLVSIGLPRARAETIQALARAVCNGQISFDGIADSEAFLTRLCEIPGIGEWTAQYVAMRALGEPDAFPCGDLGLLHALKLESSRELERRAEAWRPWRAYATMYLWNTGSEYGARGSHPLSSRTSKTSHMQSTSQASASAAV